MNPSSDVEQTAFQNRNVNRHQIKSNFRFFCLEMNFSTLSMHYLFFVATLNVFGVCPLSYVRRGLFINTECVLC